MHSGFVLAIIGAVVSALLAFQPPAGIWALGLLWALLFGLLNYDHHRDRVHILGGLRRRDNALVYTKLVDSMLRVLKRMLSPPDTVADPMPAKGKAEQFAWLFITRARDPDDLKRLQASTFSWPVVDAALKIAVIYPLLLLLLQWGITGEDTGIGAVIILAEEKNAWLRVALVFPLAALVICLLLMFASQSRILAAASSWLLVLTFAFPLVIAVAFTGEGAVAFVVAFAVAYAVAFAGAFAGAFAVATAVAVAGIAAGIYAVLVVDAASVAGAFATLVAGAFAGAFAVGYGCSQGKGGLAYTAYVFAVWTSLAIAFGISSDALEPDLRVFVFAIGLLPLINAVFDYFSYGITLGLIRYGRRQRNLLTGLVWLFDGVIAVVLLIGLGLALSGTIALINHLAGQEFIALRTIFDDLKTPEKRAGYTWLTLTLLSTLVPTLVHLFLVFLSAFTWLPQRFKHWIARGIEDPEAGDLATLGGSAAAATLGALWAAFVALGLLAVWLFVTEYIEPVGLAVLWIVENVAIFQGWVERGPEVFVVPSTDT